MNACILPSRTHARGVCSLASDFARRFRIRDAPNAPAKSRTGELHFAGLTADQAAAAASASRQAPPTTMGLRRAWLRRAISKGTAGK